MPKKAWSAPPTTKRRVAADNSPFWLLENGEGYVTGGWLRAHPIDVNLFLISQNPLFAKKQRIFRVKIRNTAEVETSNAKEAVYPIVRTRIYIAERAGITMSLMDLC